MIPIIHMFSAACFSFIYSRSEKIPIKGLKARQIFDSRGNPTVEVDLTTEKGICNNNQLFNFIGICSFVH